MYLRDNTKNWTPIHYAVSKSKINMIKFILEKTEPQMIDLADQQGNTPLHIAIERSQKESLEFLLDKGANAAILNKDSQAPIHYCIVNEKPEMLDILLSHPANKVDIHLGGENGGTALHYCAFNDNLECAMILLKHKANLCRPCDNGFFPVHMAAQNCANKVLEFLIAEGFKKGCSKLKMLSFVDGDHNKPLHAAVQFSNIGAVRLCLDNGASIDEVIDIDNSTPLHIACAQGSMDIVQLMYEKQTDIFLEVVHAQGKVIKS
jgi:transient receptor potential cation channel subfamily A protein 1